MRAAKVRFAVIAVLVIAGAITPWLIQRQSEIKLREENRFLRTQLDQLTQQRTGDESRSNQIAQGISPLPNDQLSELLKLRNEVNLLRKETNELSKLRPENHRLSSARTQLDQLTQQRTGDESRSNQIAQGISPLPNDQLSELLKLRNEV